MLDVDNKIPVSAIIMTRNEASVIERCIDALSDFGEVFVVDSNSKDKTRELAEKAGAIVKDFKWNGKYPKKKQWCLDNLPLKYDWALIIDADEVLTPELIDEIKNLSISYSQCAGYFIKGRNVVEGKALRYGICNNKLMLLNRTKMEFPVIDDLDIAGGNEVEGNYQPVLKQSAKNDKIVQLKSPLLHYVHESGESWDKRHKRYVDWEVGMTAKGAWPEDPVNLRQRAKELFRKLPVRHWVFFAYAYIFKLGILDGKEGYEAAHDKMRYYEMIQKKLKAAD
jgi:glycosyltransferase involved in cell wall biosynthesis